MVISQNLRSASSQGLTMCVGVNFTGSAGKLVILVNISGKEQHAIYISAVDLNVV